MNKNVCVFRTKVTINDVLKFGDVQLGDQFFYKDECYTKIDIKCKNEWDRLEEYNAINLFSGELGYFNGTTQVTSVENRKKWCRSGLKSYSDIIAVSIIISLILLGDCILIGLLHISPFWFFIKVLIFLIGNVLMCGMGYSSYINDLD